MEETPDDLSASDPSASAAVCASSESDQCPYDQPLFVTCPAGAIFDAGSLTCSTIYPSGGSASLCCGACATTVDAALCEGGDFVACTTPYQYDTTGCNSVTLPEAGLAAPVTWCCP